MGIMEHLSISNRPFPAALNVKKAHVEVTYGKGVGHKGTIVITQGISIGSSGMSIKMRTVNGSNCIVKEWEKFGVVEDEIWYRVVNSGQSDMI